MANNSVRLDQFSNSNFDRGRSSFVEFLWMVVQSLFVSSWIPGSAHRAILLRFFGARIGESVNLKPFLKVKFPWRLEIGDHTWIGEGVWIDNLVPVKIGKHCCISQGAYFCTGSHDWSVSSFDLLTSPINVDDGAWVCASCVVAPGVKIGAGAVLSLGSVAARDLEPWTIYRGNPAMKIRPRSVS
jgi:putative colanic acid biosynthesis acetyltransferase WcaF